LAFEKGVLAFENKVLAFENGVPAFEEGILAFVFKLCNSNSNCVIRIKETYCILSVSAI
jgi:hypothetical protein